MVPAPVQGDGLSKEFLPGRREAKVRTMKRNTILRILNPILGILALNQILTGVFRGALSREAFEIVHEEGGFVFAGAALLHVFLNWNWVKASFLRRR